MSGNSVIIKSSDQMSAIELLSPQEICQLLGTRVRVLRLGQNLTQAELAQRAGVSLASLRRMEKAGVGALAAWVRIIQALQAHDLLAALAEPTVDSIAALERQSVGEQRRRASRRASLNPRSGDA